MAIQGIGNSTPKVSVPASQIRGASTVGVTFSMSGKVESLDPATGQGMIRFPDGRRVAFSAQDVATEQQVRQHAGGDDRFTLPGIGTPSRLVVGQAVGFDPVNGLVMPGAAARARAASDGLDAPRASKKAAVVLDAPASSPSNPDPFIGKSLDLGQPVAPKEEASAALPTKDLPADRNIGSYWAFITKQVNAQAQQKGVSKVEFSYTPLEGRPYYPPGQVDVAGVYDVWVTASNGQRYFAGAVTPMMSPMDPGRRDKTMRPNDDVRGSEEITAEVMELVQMFKYQEESLVKSAPQGHDRDPREVFLPNP